MTVVLVAGSGTAVAALLAAVTAVRARRSTRRSQAVRRPRVAPQPYNPDDWGLDGRWEG